MVYTADEMAKLLGMPTSILRYYDKEELQHTLSMVEYKCWYHETAQTTGTIDPPKNMPDAKIPPQFCAIPSAGSWASSRRNEPLFPALHNKKADGSRPGPSAFFMDAKVQWPQPQACAFVLDIRVPFR